VRLGAFLPPWGRYATPEDFDRVAEGVEAMGYDSLWTGDHVVFPEQVVSRYPYNATGEFPFDRRQPLYEPLTLLAYLAARTSRVRLGISVLVLPMRNPVVAATQLAGIAALARGRLSLGVGVGWMREEFEALGANFEARGEVMDEWMLILRRLWRGGGPAPFEGRHYRFPALAVEPQPAHPISLLVGGNSRLAMRRAVRLGDGWHGVRLGPEELAQSVRWLEARLGEEGRGRQAFQVVLRTAAAGGDLEGSFRRYSDAGVDELILEVPEASTDERLEVFEAAAKAVRR
jgi:probable F420-dependent oxidoreductase